MAQRIEAADNSVRNLIQTMRSTGEDYIADETSETKRRELLASARALVATLESPEEVLGMMNWLEPERWAAIRVAIDLQLFDSMKAKGGSSSSLSYLAEASGADAQLLDRLLKIMVAANILYEAGPSEYSLNRTSALLTDPAYQGLVCDSFDSIGPSCMALPAFLKATNYMNPNDSTNTPWKLAKHTDLHYFDWVKAPKHVEELAHLNGHMTAKNIGMKRWFSVLDPTTILGPSSQLDSGAAVLVDVGGNVGHDILAFEAAVGQTLPGKLILQDLPSVVSSLRIPSTSNVEVMPHDFFTPQPVKGAKAYYLHMVLHDWPDDKCREILQNIVPAMEKGYSKILINDAVIAAKGAGWQETGIDLIMMVVHAATERTEKRWQELLGSVGLKITKIWDCEGSPEKLIEVDMADE